MITTVGRFEIDDDPARVDRDAVWRYLSTEAYWGRDRSRADVEAQLDDAWRVVAAYDGDGATIGFARAVWTAWRSPTWPTSTWTRRRAVPGSARRSCG